MDDHIFVAINAADAQTAIRALSGQYLDPAVRRVVKVLREALEEQARDLSQDQDDG